MQTSASVAGYCNDRAIGIVENGVNTSNNRTLPSFYGMNTSTTGNMEMYGSWRNLWGRASTTPTQLNATTFGFMFYPENVSTVGTSNVYINNRV